MKGEVFDQDFHARPALQDGPSIPIADGKTQRDGSRALTLDRRRIRAEISGAILNKGEETRGIIPMQLPAIESTVPALFLETVGETLQTPGRVVPLDGPIGTKDQAGQTTEALMCDAFVGTALRELRPSGDFRERMALDLYGKGRLRRG
jgi:hypothetical protein